MNRARNISDGDLILLIKKDEKDAFRELFEKYAPRIYSFSLSYLKNEAEAEELVQNVFLKIWKKRDRINASQNIKSFIFTVATNSLYDYIRHKKIEESFYQYARINQTEQDNTTWNSVVYNETRNNLGRLVKQLPAQQQIIFNLSKMEGLSNDEIGVKMGLNKRTVENHLYRAISFLKQNLKETAVIFFGLLTLPF